MHDTSLREAIAKSRSVLISGDPAANPDVVVKLSGVDAACEGLTYTVSLGNGTSSDSTATGGPR